jgi:hypothetical protein
METVQHSQPSKQARPGPVHRRRSLRRRKRYESARLADRPAHPPQPAAALQLWRRLRLRRIKPSSGAPPPPSSCVRRTVSATELRGLQLSRSQQQLPAAAASRWRRCCGPAAAASTTELSVAQLQRQLWEAAAAEAATEKCSPPPPLPPPLSSSVRLRRWSSTEPPSPPHTQLQCSECGSTDTAPILAPDGHNGAAWPRRNRLYLRQSCLAGLLRAG